MLYFLSRDAVLKWLEIPSVYHMKKDDLYELDDNSFLFLKTCMSEKGCNSEDMKFIRYCLKEDILTRDKVAVQRPSVLKAHEPSLRYLELQITDKCNLHCKHCYIGDAGGSELSGRDFHGILVQLTRLCHFVPVLV